MLHGQWFCIPLKGVCHTLLLGEGGDIKKLVKKMKINQLEECLGETGFSMISNTINTK